ADVEGLGAEPDQPLVGRAPEGAEDLEVVDRLEEVRLARAVVADDGHADARETELELREVPEVAEAQLDTNQRVGRGGHGHGRIYAAACRPATPAPHFAHAEPPEDHTEPRSFFLTHVESTPLGATMESMKTRGSHQGAALMKRTRK